MYVYTHTVTDQSANVIFYGLQNFLCFIIIPQKKQNIYIESIYTAPASVYIYIYTQTLEIFLYIRHVAK